LPKLKEFMDPSKPKKGIDEGEIKAAFGVIIEKQKRAKASGKDR